MAKAPQQIRIGVGGWTFEPWRGGFFPPGLAHARELHHASRHLSAIEINGTFYRTQTPATFAKWHDETPDDFMFSVKAPRYATNRKVLAEAGESVARFVSSGLEKLERKLGPLLWQFAPTKKFDAADFEAFLKLLPEAAGAWPLRHAVEVRHASFRCAEFVALARQYGVAIVVEGDSVHPLIIDATAPFVYARIMGTTEEEPLGYAPARLDEWAQTAKNWAAGRAVAIGDPVEAHPPKPVPRDVFLFVISGHKAANPVAAMALMQRMG